MRYPPPAPIRKFWWPWGISQIVTCLGASDSCEKPTEGSVNSFSAEEFKVYIKHTSIDRKQILPKVTHREIKYK